MASSFVSTAPPPPKRTASPKAAAAQKIAEENNALLHHQRASGLNDLAQGVSLILMGLGLKADAGAVAHFAPGIIEPVVKYADVNEEWAKKLDAGAQIGPVATIVLATVPLFAQIAVNHGIIKVERMAPAGVVRPETLELETQALLDRAHSIALRDQIEAARQRAELQREAELLEEELSGYGEADYEDAEMRD